MVSETKGWSSSSLSISALWSREDTQAIKNKKVQRKAICLLMPPTTWTQKRKHWCQYWWVFILFYFFGGVVVVVVRYIKFQALRVQL